MGRTILKGATLINGCGEVFENCNVMIEGETIEAVDSNFDNMSELDAEIVDLKGKYIMPGMINTHVHMLADPKDPNSIISASTDSIVKTTVQCLENLDIMLQNGVTYFRDCGSPRNISIDMRNLIREKKIIAPEALVCGSPVVMTGGHGWRFATECDGPYNVMRATREQIKFGADFIKLMTTGGYSTLGVRPEDMQLTLEELSAAVTVAKNSNRKTATHVMGIGGIENAVNAGIDTLEHAELLAADDRGRVEKIIDKMVQNNTAVVPTLSCSFYNFTNEFGFLETPDEEYIARKFIRQPWFANNPAHGPIEWKSTKDVLEGFKLFHKAGIKIAAGNDGGLANFHFNALPFELKLMILAGMTNMEAIMTATKNAAEVLGVGAHYGTIEVGKKADIIVLSENPLVDIDALYKIEEVYKLGQKVKTKTA